MYWKVADVMSSPAIVVREGVAYRLLVDTLWRHHISGVGVVDQNGRITGVVSESDLMLREELPNAERNRHWTGILRELSGDDAKRTALLDRLRKAEATTAGGLMTAPAVVIGPDATLTEAARLMNRERVKRLMVVDGDRRPLGVATRSDLLKVFLRTDADLVDDARAVAPPAVEVSVKDGVAHLAGEWAAPEEVGAAERAVESVPGIVRVMTEFPARS